jgi:hypothetical protein
MNETLLLLTALISTGFILVSWKMGKERLYTVIIIFLVLISIGGGKIVEYFGLLTNIGNIFYASVFLSTYFLIERYGRDEGLRSIWIGVLGVIFFLTLAKIGVAMVGSETTLTFSNALDIIFNSNNRIAYASIIAYVLSQTLNVYLYVYLKKKFGGAHRWFRANITNAIAQILDSIVFFTIAFMGVLPTVNMIEVIATGFIIKIVFMMLAAPILRFNTLESEESSGYSTIVIP